MEGMNKDKKVTSTKSTMAPKPAVMATLTPPTPDPQNLQNSTTNPTFDLPQLPSMKRRISIPFLPDRFSWTSTSTKQNDAQEADAPKMLNARDSLVIHHKKFSNRFSRASADSTAATIGTSKDNNTINSDVERGDTEDTDEGTVNNASAKVDITSSSVKTYLFLTVILVIFLGIFTAIVVLSIQSNKDIQSTNFIIPKSAKPLVILVQDGEGKVTDSVVKWALKNGTVLV